MTTEPRIPQPARTGPGRLDSGHSARPRPGCGDVGTLINRADAGNRHAASQLADLLVLRAAVGTLTAPPDNGDQTAAIELAELLAQASESARPVQV